MRIALFHELPYGGARRAVLGYGRALSKNNEVDLYYIDESKEKNIKEIFSSVHYFPFIPKKWSGNNWRVKLYKDTIELLRLYILHRKIANIINKKNYDFVFVHGSKYTQTPFIPRFLNKFSVYYCQEPLRMVYENLFTIPNDLSWERRIYERINRNNRRIIDLSNVKKVDLLLANSKFTKKNIKRFYKLDSTVLYMGVDLKRFFPVKTKKKFDILFVGSKDDIDGYNLLLNVLKRMRSKPKVRYLLRENEWISDDRILRKLYSESRFLICLAYKEPFGLLPIEAQACGTGVIAVKEGGYMDTIIDGKTGIFVKRDEQDISSTLSRILSNPKIIQNLGDNARKNVVENWTWDINSSKLLKLIRNSNV